MAEKRNCAELAMDGTMHDSLAAILVMAGHDLQYRTPLGDIKFFEPKPVFGAWMVTQFDGLHLWDVGAGIGHVAKELSERGFDVTAIDIMRRDNPVFPVMMVDGFACGYSKGDVVMLCRPCHGIFPAGVIAQAVRCKVGAIVYVGMPRNLNMDLGKYRRHFRRELTKAGENGESVYVWRNPTLPAK